LKSFENGPLRRPQLTAVIRIPLLKLCPPMPVNKNKFMILFCFVNTFCFIFDFESGRTRFQTSNFFAWCPCPRWKN